MEHFQRCVQPINCLAVAADYPVQRIELDVQAVESAVDLALQLAQFHDLLAQQMDQGAFGLFQLRQPLNS